MFTEAPANALAGAVDAGFSCGLDTVNGNYARRAAVDRLGSADFVGWVGDNATRQVPRTFTLVLLGAQVFQVRGRAGGPRPDVAAALGIPAFAQSGFDVNAYLTNVPVGDYQVRIYYQIDGKEKACAIHGEVFVQ